MALCVACGLDTKLEDAVPLEPMSSQGTRSSHQLVTVGKSVVLRAEYPRSESDSTMWCREAAARSAVLPSENRKVTKANTEKGDAATCMCAGKKHVNGTGRDVSSHTT